MNEESIQQTQQGDNDNVTMNFYYRLIKLSSGEDIIGQVPELDTGSVLLVRQPVKILAMFDPAANDAVFAFYPWNPFTSQELIPINRSHVISMTSVKEKVRQMYLRQLATMATDEQPQTLEDVANRMRPTAEKEPEPETVEPVEAEPAVKGKRKRSKTATKEWVN